MVTTMLVSQLKLAMAALVLALVVAGCAAAPNLEQDTASAPPQAVSEPTGVWASALAYTEPLL